MDGQKVLISSFRNEAPFVLEFVAHHKAVGFDQIIIASNDCSDGTDAILDALDRAGVITHVPCQPIPKVSPQAFAYDRIRSTLPVDRAAWLMILDADEYLNIHVGQRRLEDLIAAQSNAELVLINWACFGSIPHDRWADEPSGSRFVYRLRTMSGEGHVKSLIRHPAKWAKFSNHHPFGWLGGDRVRIAFAGGLWSEDVAKESLTLGAYRDVKPQVGTFRFAQINHYATRTKDSFDLRRARGRGAAPQGHANERHSEAYFRRMSCGTFLDDTITRYAPEVAARIADFHAIPGVGDAVRDGIRLYQAEIDRYWQRVSTDAEREPK